MKIVRTASTTILTTVLFFAIVLSCQPPKNKAKITASIAHCKDSVVLLRYTDSTDTIALSADGSLSTEISLNKPLWIQLELGNNKLSLYLQPGSEINLKLDAENFVDDVDISGADSEINIHILTQNNVFYNHRCNKASFIYETDVKEYLAAIDEMTKEIQDNYDAFVKQYGEKHRHFCDNEKLRIQFMLAEMKLVYSRFIDYNTKLSDTEKADFYLFLKEINLNKPENAELHEFRSFASAYIDWKAASASTMQNSPITNEAGFMQYVFEIIQTDFTDKAIIEYLYFIKLYDFMLYMGLEDLEDNYDEFSKLSNNQQHKDALKAIYDKWKKLAKGLPSPHFAGVDMNGKTHELSEFTGKLIIIDVWASWCGPCIREIPYIEKLKKEYRNKQVAFVGISVDDSYEDWVGEIENSKITGNQWFVKGWNNTLCDAYNINSIPRFILIDHKGNIVNINAPKPSGDLKQLIDTWLAENTSAKL